MIDPWQPGHAQAATSIPRISAPFVCSIATSRYSRMASPMFASTRTNESDERGHPSSDERGHPSRCDRLRMGSARQVTGFHEGLPRRKLGCPRSPLGVLDLPRSPLDLPVPCLDRRDACTPWEAPRARLGRQAPVPPGLQGASRTKTCPLPATGAGPMGDNRPGPAQPAPAPRLSRAPARRPSTDARPRTGATPAAAGPRAGAGRPVAGPPAGRHRRGRRAATPPGCR